MAEETKNEDLPKSALAEGAPEGSLVHRDPVMVDPTLGSANQEGAVAQTTEEYEPVLMSPSAAKISKKNQTTEADEVPPEIRAGFWAIISPQARGAIKDYAGREVRVISAPEVPITAEAAVKRSTVPGGRGTQVPEDAIFTVQTRDADSQLLQVTAEDLEHVSEDRAGLPTAG